MLRLADKLGHLRVLRRQQVDGHERWAVVRAEARESVRRAAARAEQAGPATVPVAAAGSLGCLGDLFRLCGVA